MAANALAALQLNATPDAAAGLLKSIGWWGLHDQLALLRLGVSPDFESRLQVVSQNNYVHLMGRLGFFPDIAFAFMPPPSHPTRPCCALLSPTSRRRAACEPPLDSVALETGLLHCACQPSQARRLSQTCLPAPLQGGSSPPGSAACRSPGPGGSQPWYIGQHL